MPRPSGLETERAWKYLDSGGLAPKEALKLAKDLKKKQAFGLARRVLQKARQVPVEDLELKIELGQQHALCTYKDRDLLRGRALEDALDILDGVDHLKTATRKETLGIAGAIHKRMWEVDRHKRHLERSLHYYLRGADSDHEEPDYGYTAINAAYVLDLLAHIEQAEGEGRMAESVRQRQEKARAIRHGLVQALPNTAEQEPWLMEEWWFLVTVAEACFGLRQFDQAKTWLERAVRLKGTPDWEVESTARQLTRLALLMGIDLAPRDEDRSKPDVVAVKEALFALTGGDARVLEAMLLGKVGLALSGGGFRASLFHLGVLARLAELDVLRHISVLSCVSGGSIVGAHYYLELRRELKRTPDKDLGPEDYIKIIDRVSRTFLEGVQRNIRTRVASNLIDNIRMMVGRKSRTERLGELIEREIYGSKDGAMWINDLKIDPAGWEKPEAFQPKLHNWRRAHKVPILVLNATSLNTGHNWQFTATWMGEPPEGVNSDVDTNDRLRRMYYEDAPAPYTRFRLGHAVAASACVPGLFEPLSLPNLYKRDAEGDTDRVVELVDGGVHDNQGCCSLLEQDCDVILVSDASGQMGTEPAPKDNVISVPLRSNSILMGRVRVAQFDELDARLKGTLLRGLMFIHLKQGLDTDSIDWEPMPSWCKAADHGGQAARDNPRTPCGVLKKIQERLAAVRTDLDSFSYTEAYALMLSGYRMCSEAFRQGVGELPRDVVGSDQWAFCAPKLEAAMTKPESPGTEELDRLLVVSKERAFKIWRLVPALRITSWTLGVIFLGLALWLGFRYGSVPVLTLSQLTGTLLSVLVVALLGKWAVRMIKARSTLWKAVVGVALCVVGWLAAWTHLLVFDRWFRKRAAVLGCKRRPTARQVNQTS